MMPTYAFDIDGYTIEVKEEKIDPVWKTMDEFRFSRKSLFENNYFAPCEKYKRDDKKKLTKNIKEEKEQIVMVTYEVVEMKKGMTHVSECNRGNCTAIGCKQHGFNSQYPEETQHFSQKKGCLSHPRAREVVMAGVVEELEKESKENRESGDTSDDSYLHGFADGVDEAIDLIRGGGRE